MESNLYSGKNTEGEEILISIQNGIGMKISTYQNNNWIRINDYTIINEENNQYIERTETYEKDSN